MTPNFRVGFGYDVHQLKEGATFTLGGIEIEHSKGAVGHSDADVLVHVICDALLGALALGDIGTHFPDTSADFKGIDSKILLKRVIELIEENGYKIANVDSTVALQKPKIKDLIPHMKTALLPVIKIEENQLSIKATTTEKLGFVGTEKGVKAYAVCLVEKL